MLPEVSAEFYGFIERTGSEYSVRVVTKIDGKMVNSVVMEESYLTYEAALLETKKILIDFKKDFNRTLLQ